MSKIKAAAVYRYADSILVHSQHRATSGLSLAGDPFFLMRAGGAPDELGRALRMALDASRSNVPNPETPGSVTRALVAAAGLRSYRQLQRQAIFCTVREGEGRIHLTPTHNGGTAGEAKGFQGLLDRRVTVVLGASDEVLGDALLEALERCTSAPK